MSALAMTQVAPRRLPVPEAPRHIEIAPSRSQRRARPRTVYAVVTIAGLFAVLIAQLLLSIVVSDGAYQISSLQQQQKELTRDQQSLTEQLQVLNSPQHLAANAVSLGMVSTPSMAYLRLADGVVLGQPVAARASDAIKSGPNGAPLIPNELLAGVPVLAAATGSETTAGAAGTTLGAGAPGTISSSGSVASSNTGLPSPVTR